MIQLRLAATWIPREHFTPAEAALQPFGYI